ncbi:MAG: DUF4956 domain-containing protein [Bacilli bacterium]|nr:DUF4956 domain-containing protein [Bacilli bacterium]
MFDSIYPGSSYDSYGNLVYQSAQPWQYFIVLGAALATGLLFSWIMSLRLRATKRFFIVNALMPALIATIVTFVNENVGIGAGIAIGSAFFAIRFRSAPGTAEELVCLLLGMAGGVVFGLGYVAYGVIFLIGLGLVYFGVTYLPIFEHKNLKEEKMLKITVPESLNYSEVFNDIFDHYLKERELVGVKTTAMGSMFKLSFRVKMKDYREEKQLIDELRTRNGNLEISVLPYSTNPSNL